MEGWGVEGKGYVSERGREIDIQLDSKTDRERERQTEREHACS